MSYTLDDMMLDIQLRVPLKDIREKVRADVIDEIDKTIDEMIACNSWCMEDLCVKDISCDECALATIKVRLTELKKAGEQDATNNI